ncbi:pentapeptide repeat-containing protein [Kitasatospora sp. NPDC097643]|uniref:pentapeptide repeat-containing protein n=1 Tax=Kitasatospora sp. NPDC097643 TaxID=3157230 RepID=UPI003320BE8A
MSFLMRAPRECASWTWDLEGVREAGLESVLAVAAQMSGVLRRHGLLVPGALEWTWFQVGKGGLGIHSRLSLVSRSLEEPALAEEMRACRPVGHPLAEMGAVTVFGDGEWIDAGGKRRREYRLVELMVSPGNLGPYAELSVHHDVWGECDFRGRPHPAVHASNAPRLAAVLQELDELLGVRAEPGEATYFGKAEGYGLEAPELIDGLGPDLTDGIGQIVTSGVPDSWRPKALPVDRKAADRLGAWAASSGREVLEAVGLDLRGADLSGGDLTGAWFTDAVLAGVSLAGAELWRAHSEKADLDFANLAGASLVKAALDQATLRSVCLDDADLTSASLVDVNAAGATLRRADLTNAALLQVDLRGADLSGATTANTSFTVLVDDSTVLCGVTGALFGPVTVAPPATLSGYSTASPSSAGSPSRAPRSRYSAASSTTPGSTDRARAPGRIPTESCGAAPSTASTSTRPSPATCAGSRPSTCACTTSGTTTTTTRRSPGPKPTRSSSASRGS